MVRGILQTNSRFFSCIGDSSPLYIFGIWPSLDAHLQLLASPARNEILGSHEAFLDFQWTIHLATSSFKSRLLDAPFLVVESFGVRTDHVDAYDQYLAEHVRRLESITNLSSPVVGDATLQQGYGRLSSW